MASYFDDHDVTEDQIPTGGLDPQFVQMLERMNQINIGESNDEQGTRVPEWTSDLMLAWPDLLQNMAATSENPPASKEVLENLEEVTVEASPVKGGKLACPICTDEFDVKAVQLPCKHLFHRQCIVPWLEKVRATQAIPNNCSR